MADVQNGLGPYLAVFLKGAQGWGAGDIGIAMAVSNIAAAASQIPAGMLVDALRIKRLLVAAAALSSAAGQALAHEAPESHFGRLDHVFLIIMENQTDTDILRNPNAHFINSYATVANQATNYFAVGHPSAPNYLEITGGSNFGVSNDFWPAWYGAGCIDKILVIREQW